MVGWLVYGDGGSLVASSLYCYFWWKFNFMSLTFRDGGRQPTRLGSYQVAVNLHVAYIHQRWVPMVGNVGFLAPFHCSKRSWIPPIFSPASNAFSPMYSLTNDNDRLVLTFRIGFLVVICIYDSVYRRFYNSIGDFMLRHLHGESMKIVMKFPDGRLQITRQKPFEKLSRLNI